MGVPLILEMAGKRMAALPDWNIQQAALGVAKINDHAHRRTDAHGSLFNRRRRAGAANGANLKITGYPGYSANNRVGDGEFVVLAPLPFANVLALDSRSFLDAFLQGSQQFMVPIGEPAGGPRAEEVFDDNLLVTLQWFAFNVL